MFKLPLKRAWFYFNQQLYDSYVSIKYVCIKRRRDVFLIFYRAHDTVRVVFVIRTRPLYGRRRSLILWTRHITLYSWYENDALSRQHCTGQIFNEFSRNTDRVRIYPTIRFLWKKKTKREKNPFTVAVVSLNSVRVKFLYLITNVKHQIYNLFTRACKMCV